MELIDKKKDWYVLGAGNRRMALVGCDELLEAYELIGAKLREKGVIMPNE